MIPYRTLAWVILCSMCLACGGPEFAIASGEGEGGPSGADARGTSDAPPDTGPVVGGDAATPACPNVAGAYAVAIVDAIGCGDLSITAPQCIQQNSQACAITFVSQDSTNTAAINGDATLQDRTFGGAQLKEGTVDRSGCTGVWDPTTSTLTVDCGGVGTAQSCVVSLRRTAAHCS
jgi:hypothetical protein